MRLREYSADVATFFHHLRTMADSSGSRSSKASGKEITKMAPCCDCDRWITCTQPSCRCVDAGTACVNCASPPSNRCKNRRPSTVKETANRLLNTKLTSHFKPLKKSSGASGGRRSLDVSAATPNSSKRLKTAPPEAPPAAAAVQPVAPPRVVCLPVPAAAVGPPTEDLTQASLGQAPPQLSQLSQDSALMPPPPPQTQPESPFLPPQDVATLANHPGTQQGSQDEVQDDDEASIGPATVVMEPGADLPGFIPS